MNSQRPTISLIATVKNEAATIGRLLNSILAQSLAPDEIVINDDHSSDSTLVILRRYAANNPRIIIVRGSGGISAGRNHAIAKASGSVIACCDAGTELSQQWLETIVAPILNGHADVVGGFAALAHRSAWELALGVTTMRQAAEIDGQNYLPAGNSIAFTRAAWAHGDGFPEWATTCEDLIFALERKRAGFRFAFEPAALVYFQPRRTPQAYFRQYFRYAQGDGIANLWPWRHAVRYLVYGLLLSFGCAYCWRPCIRLRSHWQGLSLGERLLVPLLIPFVRLIGDIAKMCGYVFGRIQRRQRDIPFTYQRIP